MPEPGLIVVDKPSGWTSHQIVGRVRRLVGTRKVGHAGTLDPMATGVLLVGIERATRLLGHLAGQDKDYLATIRLGQATVTDDAEGDVISSVPAAFDRAVLEGAIAGYRGDIVQVPSAVSAIKVDGKRSYARVRAGEEVELAGRSVTVSDYRIDAVRPGPDGLPVTDLDVRVTCSSGTYIRALARDLGRDLGVGGHLTALRRTRVGGFGLADVTLDGSGLAGSVQPTVMPLIEVARRSFSILELDDEQARDVRYGRAISTELSADPTGLVHAGEFLALYRPDPRGAVPVAVFVG